MFVKEFKNVFSKTTVQQKYFVVFISTVLLIFANYLLPRQEIGWHGRYYVELSKNLFLPENHPTRFRILSPVIAHLMPFSPESNFKILTYFCTFLSSILIYVFIRQNCFTHKQGIIGISFFIFSSASLPSLNYYGFVDPLTYLLLLLSLIFIKRKYLFSLLISLAVLNRETAILFVPLYYLFNLQNNILERKLLKDTLLIFIISTLTFIISRTLVSLVTNFEDYLGFGYYFYNSIEHQKTALNAKFSIYMKGVWGTFDLVWVLMFFGVFSCKKKWLYSLIYLLLIGFGQTLIALDTNRMIAVAFPMVIAVSLIGLEPLLNLNRRFQYFFLSLFYSIFLITPGLYVTGHEILLLRKCLTDNGYFIFFSTVLIILLLLKSYVGPSQSLNLYVSDRKSKKNCQSSSMFLL
jgi:hypothetical protein